MADKIFGYDWEEIRREQQGESSGLRKNVKRQSREECAAEIMRDVERFNLPVSDSVVKGYGLILPDSYKLEGDTWKHESPA